MKSLFVVLACLTVLSTFGVLQAHAADSTDCKNIDPNAPVKTVAGAAGASTTTQPAGKVDISK